MTDAGDGGNNPGDADTDHRSLEEVRAELARLTSPEAAPEWRKIELRAKILVRGSTIHCQDLVHTVAERLLAKEGKHRRRWHKKEIFSACFERTMKSIVRDYWRGEQNAIVPIDGAAAGLREAPDPERQAMAREELGNIRDLLQDDKNTLEIAMALAGGETRAEIIERLHLTDTEYETARKRVSRKLMRQKITGGQS